jgi:hypothetical protein
VQQFADILRHVRQRRGSGGGGGVPAPALQGLAAREEALPVVSGGPLGTCLLLRLPCWWGAGR